MRITSSSVCAALLGAAATATTALGAQPPAAADEVAGAYIVELDAGDSPAAFYARLARDHGIAAEHRMDLASRALFHGASFRVPNATTAGEHAALLTALQTQAQARAVWPLRTVALDGGTPGPHDVPGASPAGASASPPPPLGRRDGPGAQADRFSPHLMTQIDRLHARGLTGKGFRIAIVDSGVDYTHPALGGCFGPGCLVEAGWDLVGDTYTPPGLPVPDSDPYDGCVGHGTHVAGTIAAQLQGNAYNFTGAAPGVKLAAYRAWGCPAKATTDVLIAAFIRAFEDGNDIISCSDGDLSGWSDDPWALVVSRIAAAGVPVVLAAGNDGGSGLFSASTPAGARGATGVGAVQNAVFPLFVSDGEYTVASSGGGDDDDDGTPRTFGYLAGTPAAPRATTLALWAVGDEATPANNACGPLPADTPDLADKLVLLRVPDARKTRCYPIDQGQNIADKGGRYMAYIVPGNNTFEEQYIYVDGIEGVISVAPFQGAAWLDALGRGANVTVTVPGPEANATTLMELEDRETGGYMGDFSSWGPTWELSTVPQVTAPGGKILSTYPLALGGYRIMTGTSMACPLIAGVLALLGEARGSVKDTDLLLRLLAGTAQPNVWFDGKTADRDLLAPVSQQGAGMVQAYDAAFARTVLSTHVLSANDTEHFVGEHRFSIENTGTEAATYRLSHLRSATQYAMAPAAERPIMAGFPNPAAAAWAELQFAPDTVTVPAGAAAEVTVTVTPPAGLNATLLPLYSGYVAVNGTRAGSDEEERLVLPYLGVAGPMRATPALLGATSFLADFGSPAAANRTYTLPTPDPARLPYLNNPNADPVHRPDQATTPNLVLAPVVGPRALHVDVVALDGDAAARNRRTTPTGRRALGPLAGYPQAFVARREQRAFFEGLLADGTVLPAGAYRLVASALRVFGDAAAEADWDVIETVPFVVRYEAAANGTAATAAA